MVKQRPCLARGRTLTARSAVRWGARTLISARDDGAATRLTTRRQRRRTARTTVGCGRPRGGAAGSGGPAHRLGTASVR